MNRVEALESVPSATIDRARLLDVAQRLISVPSPTCAAGAAADTLADMLRAHGLPVDRPAAGHPAAPAVVAWLVSGKPGPTLQFNGHLDVVHLPFSAPVIDGSMLRGSGAADMKAGLAAAVEAMIALKNAGLPHAGRVLLTAHDLHEAPWGDGLQLENMIEQGIVGDAVLIPEPLCDVLPVRGRGQAHWLATIRRDGPPVHEVMRPIGQPDVVSVLSRLIKRLNELDASLARQADPVAGRSSVFIGQAHAGEIYNQSAQTAWLEGTRRWIPAIDRIDVEHDFRRVVAQLAEAENVSIEVDFRLVRDAFSLDPSAPIVCAFQEAMRELTGRALPLGPKPFVDDGNTFWSRAHIPAITHGPRAGGQHTTNEWVDLADLERVAGVYARTAALYLRPD